MKKTCYCVQDGQLKSFELSPAEAKRYGWSLTKEKAVSEALKETVLLIRDLKKVEKHLKSLKHTLSKRNGNG